MPAPGQAQPAGTGNRAAIAEDLERACEWGLWSPADSYGQCNIQ
jgi:hypothetical protein